MQHLTTSSFPGGPAKRSLLSLGLAALLFVLGATVPVTQGPVEASLSAKPFPNSCGREGQKPCPLFGKDRHIPSCMSGLVERPLGKRCSKKRTAKEVVRDVRSDVRDTTNTVHEGVRDGASVVSDGARDVGRRLGRNDRIIGKAKNVIRELGPTLKAAALTMNDCRIDSILMGLTRNNQASIAKRIQENNCWTGILENARTQGYQTVTMGVSGGGSFLVGAEGENGLAFDTSGERPVTTYHTLGIKFLSLGAGAAGTLGYWKADNTSFGGDGHGASLALTAAGGSGAAVWFGYDSDEVTGVSVSLTAGAEADVAYVRNRTEILSYTYPVAQPSFAAADLGGYKPSAAPNWQRRASRRSQQRVSPGNQAIYDGVARGTALGLEIAGQRYLEKQLRKPQTIVKACNKSDYKSINIVMAYRMPAYEGSGSRWRSEGWWTAKKGKCVNLGLPNYEPGIGYEDVMFLYATTSARDEDGNWVDVYAGNALSFCIDNDRFDFPQSRQMDCSGPNKRVARGWEMNVTQGVNRFNFNPR